MSDGQSRELVRLGTMPRRGRDGKDDELRLSLDEFNAPNGKATQYFSARVWWQGREGKWLPGKAGITFRRAEIRQVIEALERVERILIGKETVRDDDPRQQRIPGAGRGETEA